MSMERKDSGRQKGTPNAGPAHGFFGNRGCDGNARPES